MSDVATFLIVFGIPFLLTSSIIHIIINKSIKRSKRKIQKDKLKTKQMQDLLEQKTQLLKINPSPINQILIEHEYRKELLKINK